MVEYRKLLDAVIATFAPGQNPDQNGSSDRHANGLRQQLGRGVSQATGQSPDQLLQKAKDLATQHPGLTQAALVGLAGLFFSRRKKTRLTGNLVKLGGLAVIGGLAYKAYQNHQNHQNRPAPASNQSNDQLPPAAGPPGKEAAEEGETGMPEASRFHPVSQTEDDALLFLQTMVAAAAADGHIDAAERSRIVKGLTEAGIDPQATHWLETEMASPADVEELAARVNDPEKAAQVYAAARIAIDPDTIQEREFLNQLSEALDLDPSLREQIDETVSATQ